MKDSTLLAVYLFSLVDFIFCTFKVFITGHEKEYLVLEYIKINTFRYQIIIDFFSFNYAGCSFTNKLFRKFACQNTLILLTINFLFLLELKQTINPVLR